MFDIWRDTITTSFKQQPRPFLFVDWIARDRKRTAYVLYVVAGVFFVLAMATYIQYRTEWVPLALWFASLAAASAMAGIWQHFREPGLASENDLARLLSWLSEAVPVWPRL